jgi:hypothetical protein
MKYLTGGAVRTLTTLAERPKSDNPPPNAVRRLTAAGRGSTTLRCKRSISRVVAGAHTPCLGTAPNYVSGQRSTSQYPGGRMLWENTIPSVFNCLCAADRNLAAESLGGC